MRVEETTEAVRTLLHESKGEKAVSVLPKVKEHLTNIVTRMIMSKSFFGPNTSAEDSEKFQQNIRSVLVLLGVFHFGDYIPLFKHWDVQGNKKKMREAHAALDKFFQSVVDEHRQQLAEKRRYGDQELLENGDFLDVLLARSVDNDDVEITDDRIKGMIQVRTLLNLIPSIVHGLVNQLVPPLRSLSTDVAYFHYIRQHVCHRTSTNP